MVFKLDTAAHNAQNDDGKMDWPAYGTMAWLAFVYACLAAFSFWKDPRMVGVANNACLVCLFSGLAIAMVAPGYVGSWKSKFMLLLLNTSKFEVQTMCFLMVLFSSNKLTVCKLQIFRIV